MASDPNELRNHIFGKVAHLVVSERGLVKADGRPIVNVEFRLSTNVNGVLNQQMIASRISDSMVIEVFVLNKQASPGEVQEILLERWQMTWYRMGRTGVQAWTGLNDNNVDKTMIAMSRRVALSGRLTQTMHLFKKAIPHQYEIQYRILQSASTLHFGATDDRQTVIFHGHEGHTWWHINNQMSLSFTMNFRSNPWTPRSLPTHISPMAIINDYLPGASGASPSHTSTSGHTASSSVVPAPTSSSAPRYPPQTSQSPTHAHQPPMRTVSHEISSKTRTTHNEGDEYAAAPLSHHTRSTSGQIHGAYFQQIEYQDAMGLNSPNHPPISTSLPKTSHFQGIGPLHYSPSAGTATGPYVPSGGHTDTHTSPRGGSTGAGFVSFGTAPYVTPAYISPGSHPSGHPSGHPNPSNPFAHAMASVGTSPKYPSHMSSMLGNSPDRVPGSSPPSASSDRPVRTRSASNSASQILSSTSTSISPYRVDLPSTMAKSPPSHQISLPLDMVGPGTGPSRPPSSGKLPIVFGSNPSPASSQTHLPSHPGTTSTIVTSASGHTIYSTTQPYLVGSPITTSLSKQSLNSQPYITSSATSSSETQSPEPHDGLTAQGYAAEDSITGGDTSAQNDWLNSVSYPVLPPVVRGELASLAFSPPLTYDLSSYEEVLHLFDTIRQYTLPSKNPSSK